MEPTAHKSESHLPVWDQLHADRQDPFHCTWWVPPGGWNSLLDHFIQLLPDLAVVDVTFAITSSRITFNAFKLRWLLTHQVQQTSQWTVFKMKVVPLMQRRLFFTRTLQETTDEGSTMSLTCQPHATRIWLTRDNVPKRVHMQFTCGCKWHVVVLLNCGPGDPETHRTS